MVLGLKTWNKTLKKKLEENIRWFGASPTDSGIGGT